MTTDVDGNCKIGRGSESKPNLAFCFHRRSNLRRYRNIRWLLKATSNFAWWLKNWLNFTRQSKLESDIVHSGNLTPFLQFISNLQHVRSIARYITIPLSPLEILWPYKALQGLKIWDRVWWHTRRSNRRQESGDASLLLRGCHTHTFGRRETLPIDTMIGCHIMF